MTEETFSATGRVDKIDGEMVYMTVTDSHGRDSHAEILKTKLSSEEVREGDYFNIEIVEGKLVMTKRPPRVLTREEMDKIRKRLEGALPDDLFPSEEDERLEH